MEFISKNKDLILTASLLIAGVGISLWAAFIDKQNPRLSNFMYWFGLSLYGGTLLRVLNENFKR